MQGLTLDQLKQKGATPIKTGGLTLEQLQNKIGFKGRDTKEFQPERGVTETGFFKPTPKLRTRDVAREFMNTLTPGPVAFGQSIAGSLQRFTPEQKELEKSRETTSDLETQVLKAIKDKQARGEDTTRLKDVLRKTTGKEMSDFEINRAINKTTGQIIGEAGETFLDVILAGTYKGAKAGIGTAVKTGAFKKVIPTAIKGAGIGYGYDVARGLQGERGEKREGEKAFIPGLGTLIGGGIPIAIPAFQKGGGAVSKILRKKGAEEVKREVSDTVGKIIQGKVKDRTRGLKVLEEIDTEGVKTFEELGSRIREKSSATLEELNKFLDKQVGSYKVSDLVTETVVKSKIGGKSVKVKQNFVTDSIKQLKELYKKIKSPREFAEITMLERKLKTQGLTVREVNDLAKMYGREFGRRAFSKGASPKPLTSVNAQAFENTRKGIKATARGKITGKLSKTLDEKVSNMINVERLISKLEEGVNQLYQKIDKRGWGEKFGRFTFNAIDILTGRTASGFLRAGFIPRGGGLKTMNYIDIENKLSKNLKNLDKLLRTKDENAFIKGVKEMFGGAMESGTKGGFAKIPGIEDVIDKIKNKGKTTVGALVGGAGVTAPSLIGSVISDRIKYEKPKREGPQPKPTNTSSIAKGLAYAETRGEDKPYSFSQWSNPAMGEKSTYGKALGKYQVTEARLKEKSKDFLGAIVTPKEFLENPSFQEKFIKEQIDWQRSNGLTDDQIIATHRQGWGNMTKEQLEKAVKERGGYLKDVHTGMEQSDINKVVKQRAK